VRYPALLLQELVHFPIVGVFEDLVDDQISVQELGLEEYEIVGGGRRLGSVDGKVTGLVAHEERLDKRAERGRSIIESDVGTFTCVALP
jgi:hypothetical protein